jgi:hypothetical protein
MGRSSNKRKFAKVMKCLGFIWFQFDRVWKNIDIGREIVLSFSGDYMPSSVNMWFALGPIATKRILFMETITIHDAEWHWYNNDAIYRQETLKEIIAFQKWLKSSRYTTCSMTYFNGNRMCNVYTFYTEAKAAAEAKADAEAKAAADAKAKAAAKAKSKATSEAKVAAVEAKVAAAEAKVAAAEAKVAAIAETTRWYKLIMDILNL